jgi:O-antigen/teichoic acid export membrane protein
VSDTPSAHDGSLARRARKGMHWSLVNSFGGRVLNFLSGLVVARLVTPDEFGTFAAGFLVLTVLLSMNELGVSVVVVRWQGRVERILPTATTCAVGTSAIWFALAFLSAPQIASLLNAPDAVDVIRVLSFGVLLDGLSSIPNALLMRGFHQRLRTMADLVGFLLGTAVGIGLAAAGWGALGLAYGAIVTNAATTFVIWWRGPMRPRPGWTTAHARELVRAGLPLAGTSLVLLTIMNVDYVVVSRVLGVTALGFYVLAFNVASWPWTLLSKSIRRVALPGFAHLAAHRERLEETFARGLTLVAGTAVLGGVLLAALADPVVQVLYGDRWLPAIAALRWLALLGAIRIVLDLCYDLLVAVGRTGPLLKVQLVWLVALVIALPVGAHTNGIAGVAAAHVLVAAAIVLPLNVILVMGAGLRLRTLARAMAPVAGAGAAGTAIAVGALRIETAPLWTLLGVGSLVTLAYTVAFVLPNGGRAAVAWARPQNRPAEAR